MSEAVEPREDGATWRDLMTRERWIEIGRILLTGTVALLYWTHLH